MSALATAPDITQVTTPMTTLLAFTLYFLRREAHARRAANTRADRTTPAPETIVSGALATPETAPDDTPTAPQPKGPSALARWRRAYTVRRNHRKFRRSLIKPAAVPTAELLHNRPVNPHRLPLRLPLWSRLAGRTRDGRSRLLAGIGYYDLRVDALPTTTRQAEAICPIVAERPLGTKGVIVGTELIGGGTHVFDGHESYGDKDLMNGNVLIIGDPGGGKSSCLKTVFCIRPIRIGRSVAVIDSKKQLRIDENGEAKYVGEGEWAIIARALGISPIMFRRSNGTRINPLDPRFHRDTAAAAALADDPAQDESSIVGSDTLLRTLVEIPLHRKLEPEEHYALTCAHNRALARAADENRVPILSDLFHAITHPTEHDAARFMGRTAQDLADWGQPIAMTLHRMIEGDLAGIADGETSSEIDFDAPMLDFDVSALDPETDAMPMVMALIGTLLRNVWLREDGVQRIFVVDEGWHVIGNPSTARMFRRLWKFCRALGLVNVAALHRLTDLPGIDRDGSEARALLDEAATRITYALDSTNAALVSRVFDLPDAVEDLIKDLAQGHSVWKIGHNPPILVSHTRSQLEVPLTATDEAMTGTAA